MKSIVPTLNTRHDRLSCICSFTLYSPGNGLAVCVLFEGPPHAWEKSRTVQHVDSSSQFTAPRFAAQAVEHGLHGLTFAECFCCSPHLQLTDRNSATGTR